MAESVSFDGNKLLYHLERLNEWRRGENIFPLYLAMSPSSLCNHKCNFCVYDYKPFEPIFFPLEQFEKMVPDLVAMKVKAIFFSGDGEPLLNDACSSMIVLAKKNGISVALNTNGILFNESIIEKVLHRLSWIRVSVNAGTRDTYSKVHGTTVTDFDLVLHNLKQIVEFKRINNIDVTIGVQCTLTEDNIDEIEILTHLVRDIGVDYLTLKPFLKHPKTKFNSTIKNLNEKIITLISLKRLSTNDFKFYIREALFEKEQDRVYKECMSLPFMAELDAKGDLYSCGPHLGNSDFLYGNIFTTSLMDVWTSDRKNKRISYIRKQVDYNKECMPHCRHHSVNKFLWSLSNPPDHVNFI